MSPNFTNFKWNSFEESPSEPYRVRATKAVEYIDWSALRTIAAEARNIGCNIGEQYGLGGCHVVREVVFEDDVHWIARVSIPSVNFKPEENYIPAPLCQTWTALRAANMQSEIDTMAFIHEHTSIPVPRVFTYDTTATNRARAPYTYVDGVYPRELRGRYAELSSRRSGACQGGFLYCRGTSISTHRLERSNQSTG
jgi:hypothetical protein